MLGILGSNQGIEDSKSSALPTWLIPIMYFLFHFFITFIDSYFVITETEISGRDDRIWTCDFCVPNAALYQTELHPDIFSIIFYVIMQAGQDLNLQPSVLETDALPIELPTYVMIFFMYDVLFFGC